MDFYNSKSNIPEERLVRASIEGPGPGAMTRNAGPGVTATRVGNGLIRFSFADNPGTFVCVAGYAFGAATPSDVSGHTAARGDYVAPASGVDGYVDVQMADDAGAVVDLLVDEYLDITFAFAAQTRIT